MSMNRRAFLQSAIALGAVGVCAAGRAAPSKISWRERRDLFPEGIASAEPSPDSVLLWTRRPPAGTERNPPALTVEVAEDPEFARVIAHARTTVLARADWTTRVLVGGLKPAHEYWYRFIGTDGNGSRVGRTLTAPAIDDPRPVRFAFVSCQNVTQGAQTAFRRMIFEDEQAQPDERLGFVLHLGDFIYELVWYPEDRPQGMYDRRLRDLIRYPHGEKIEDFHIPTTVDDYRLAYRAYLHDPDLQDARARFPFVHMWDNHEFSWLGWQTLQEFEGVTRPAQTRKIAAYQAWFEYQPARVRRPGHATLASFDPPQVADHPITHFDEHGLGQEANNLTVLHSMLGYRVVRWGRNVDLIVTDQRGFRSADPLGRKEADVFSSPDFPELTPEEAVAMLDAGRAYQGGQPPVTVAFDGHEVPNFRRTESPQTILGAEQKAWFLQQLERSTTTWKIWGNTIGTLDGRADPQNFPRGLTRAWPGAGYATVATGDFSNALVERAEIYDFVRTRGITGFVTVSGDRHSFWAGLAAKSLPPEPFEPVGVAFVVGSISAPGAVEALEHRLAPDHPLRKFYLLDDPQGGKPAATINMLMLHGVRSCEAYAQTRDAAAARRLSNPDMAPHLKFLDWGGHGYAVVIAGSEAIETQFICIPRPVEPVNSPDGGPLRYRVSHRAKRWSSGERPMLEQRILEGDPQLSI
jgi:alkaline phosphatase D